MTQPVLPVDKTFRMVVKLVSTDGIELPFKGFALVPEDRLISFERVAAAARGLVVANRKFAKNPLETQDVKKAVKALEAGVYELEKVWDTPE